jgi:MoxR-like ATPase
MSTFQLRYSGTGERTATAVDGAYEFAEPYLPSDGLRDAVNLAIFLERPLLLEGEAGSGKSRLAYAVAYELGLPLFVWSIRSTSKARDGLYTYDAVLRLHDVQLQQAQSKIKLDRDPSRSADYVQFGELGKAFDSQFQSVVLIDEIDKADIDFPNDLLTVLEKPRQFTISETGQVIEAKQAPIVIITSNKEKGNLPKPFLRRCVYYYVQFPDTEDRLKRIIEMHHQEKFKVQPDPDLIDKALPLFLSIRKTKMQKLPGTSELLDWVEALHYFREPFPADKLPQEPNRNIPYVELLYKLRTDLERLSSGV